MPRHVYSQAPQLLDKPPHFRASRGNLLRDLGPAHYHHRMLHQQAYNSPETNIGRWLRMSRRRLLPRGFAPLHWSLFRDAGIIRELPSNNKPV
jgi:hypothetical protein